MISQTERHFSKRQSEWLIPKILRTLFCRLTVVIPLPPTTSQLRGRDSVKQAHGAVSGGGHERGGRGENWKKKGEIRMPEAKRRKRGEEKDGRWGSRNDWLRSPRGRMLFAPLLTIHTRTKRWAGRGRRASAQHKSRSHEPGAASGEESGKWKRKKKDRNEQPRTAGTRTKERGKIVRCTTVPERERETGRGNARVKAHGLFVHDVTYMSVSFLFSSVLLLVDS
jgi:hypothetical protein